MIPANFALQLFGHMIVAAQICGLAQTYSSAPKNRLQVYTDM